MNTKQNQRLGLALSGGGFRASFYHIGVLAKMAELGMLKHIESISTVSGGSIVGAAYYLMLKDLLERKIDDEITDQDYVSLVAKLEIHFLSAVQKNLRMLTFANPLKNMFMLSRSDIIGEIYERHIFKPLVNFDGRRILMHDLLINPKGTDGSFDPQRQDVGNFARVNKVPILILNATCLNTGHRWYFDAKSTGEKQPRNMILRDLTKNDRFSRFRYADAHVFRNFPLGRAVAASAGVPGIFPPLTVSYGSKRALLVDGGVYDNQGIAGLLDSEYQCTDFVISDASGQSETAYYPSQDFLSVLISSNEISSARIREEIVQNLILSHSPDSVAYFHLTRGLSTKNIKFKSGEVSDNPALMRGLVNSEIEYEVAGEAQRALANIRTDLDSFTDLEAGCLQSCGYLMSGPHLARLTNYLSPKIITGKWQFNHYLPALKMGDRRVIAQLESGSKQFLKPFRYALGGKVSTGKALILFLVSLPLLLSLWAIYSFIDMGLRNYFNFGVLEIITDMHIFREFLWHVAPIIYLFLAALVLSKISEKLILGSNKWTGLALLILKFPMSLISNLVLRIILPVIFFIPINLYINSIDRYFIKVMGKLD